MRFDLHVHSSYSDGEDDVEEILQAAQDRGLDGISITDHDTLEGSFAAQRLVREKKIDIIVVPGVEVTTSQGHLLVLGIEMPLPSRLSPEETIDLAHKQGGIAIVPHPYHFFRHGMFRIPNCDAVEVYNSKYLLGISNAWARWKAQQRNLPMVAGSDSHMADTVGLGVTEIEVDDGENVLESIRKGKTKIIGKRTPMWVHLHRIKRRLKRRLENKR